MRSIVSALVCVVVLGVAGCAAQSQATETSPAVPAAGSSEAASSAPSLAPSTAGDPADLVGMWRVADAVDGDGDSWLRIDDFSVTVWRSCGVVAGSWRATPELLAIDTHFTFGEGCRAPGESSVGWLGLAEGFDSSGDGVILLDRNNDPVATLTADPSGALPPTDPINGVTDTVPVVTDDTRALLEPGLPLPEALEPATDIVGRWVAEDGPFTAQEEPFVEFSADGRYSGSDGCNGGAGRWMLGVEGAFIATSGPSTLVGCMGASIPTWVGQTASISTATDDSGGQVLTLHDKDAQPIGRLIRG